MAQVSTTETPQLTLSINLRREAAGTRFDGDHELPLHYKHEAGYKFDWWSLRPEERGHEIEGIGLHLLTDHVAQDPNVRYVKAVAEAILDTVGEKRDRGEVPTWNEIDALRDAFDSAINEAADSVARAWLKDRGSIPLPAQP